MSGAAGPFAELLWSGPSVSYAAQAAASASAQFLMPGVAGAFEQPFIPANWWQMGRRNQRARIELGGVLTGQGSATTALFTVGLAIPAQVNTNTPGTGGGLICTTTAMTVTSLAAVGWWCTVDLKSLFVGYGTGGSNSSIQADGRAGVGNVLAGSTATSPPTTLSTMDATVQMWVYASVTFSTSSTTNSCQLTRADVWGLN